MQLEPPLRRILLATIVVILVGLPGCALVPGECRVPIEQPVTSRHHAYPEPKQPDLERSRLLGVSKLNPVWWAENADDPLPWWWKPDAPLKERQRTWFLRNPMHNFNSYIIGVADRQTHRWGIEAGSIWNEQGPFNATVTQAGPLLYLPMVSYRGRYLEWYLGWRTSGSFGGALRRAQPDSDGTGPRGSSPLSKALAARERDAELVRLPPVVEPP